MKKNVLLIIPFVLLIISCVSLKPESNYIQGIIFNSSGEAVSDCKITIDSNIIIYSDYNGHFKIPMKLNRNETELYFEKKDFEPLSIKFNSEDECQLIHVKLISFNDILGDIENFLSLSDFTKTEEYLSRLNKIKNNSFEFLFLSAVLAFKKNNFVDARKYLDLCKMYSYRHDCISEFYEILGVKN